MKGVAGDQSAFEPVVKMVSLCSSVVNGMHLGIPSLMMLPRPFTPFPPLCDSGQMICERSTRHEFILASWLYE